MDLFPADLNEIIDKLIQLFPVFDSGEPSFRNGGITIVCTGDLSADKSMSQT